MAFPLDTLIDLWRSVHSDGGDDEFIRVAGVSGGDPIPVSGTVTADQGAPNTVANAWPTKITDGTDTALVTAAGALVVDGSAVTQPVSGTIAVTQSTSPWVVSGTTSTKTDLTPSAPTAATVGTSSAQVVASNANRKGLALVNTSVNKIFLGFGAPAVLNSGITLYPGGSFEMDEYCFDLGAVNAIASAASSNLTIQEYTT